MRRRAATILSPARQDRPFTAGGDTPPTTPPRTTTPGILALLDDDGKAARLRAAYGPALATCDTQPRLVVAGRASGVELVIVTPRDSRGQSLATSVAAIRASRHGAPVYVYADRSADCIRELMPLARAGARGVLIRDVDDDATSLRQLPTRASLGHALETVTLAVQEVAPTRQLPLLLLCIEHIGRQQTATAFARRLGVSRRTLSAWARKSGARGVRSLASRTRVLAAIALVRDSGRPLEHVAHTLGFSSAAHLHNTIRRYTGLLPREAAASDVTCWSRRLLLPPPAGATSIPANRPPR